MSPLILASAKVGFGSLTQDASCGEEIGEGIVHKEVDEQDAMAAIMCCGAGSWQVSKDDVRGDEGRGMRLTDL